MAKSPVDAPLERVIAALGILGFEVVRRGNHVALVPPPASTFHDLPGVSTPFLASTCSRRRARDAAT